MLRQLHGTPPDSGTVGGGTSGGTQPPSGSILPPMSREAKREYDRARLQRLGPRKDNRVRTGRARPAEARKKAERAAAKLALMVNAPEGAAAQAACASRPHQQARPRVEMAADRSALPGGHTHPLQ